MNIWKQWAVFAALLLTALLVVVDVEAQDGAWRGAYYDNPYLLGEATVINSSALSFDWGTGSPHPDISADNFSARWTTRASFSGGTYRFFARADDEIRVMVDFQTIIDTFDRGQVGQLASADIALSAGTHQIQVDYREVTAEAYAFVTWENAATNPTNPNFPPVQQERVQEVDMGGWTTQYYANQNLSGLPSAILSETSLSNNWGTGSPLPSLPADNFSARWTANPTLNADTYRLSVRADDGVRVYVDGALVIDQWSNAVGSRATTELNLGAGQHNFIVEYYEVTGDAYLEFSFATVEQVEFVPTPLPTTVSPGGGTGTTGGSGSPANTGATGTITAYRLNIRANPTTDAPILYKLDRGATFPIVGRNRDSSWWQISANGQVGWAFAEFVAASNTGAVPVTSDSGSPAQNVTRTGYTLAATSSVNLRSEPSRAGAVLGLLPFGATADITGTNSTRTWYQIITSDGTVAWVSRSFVRTTAPDGAVPIVR